MTHVYKEIPNQRISKYKRLVGRFAIALVILFLPFATDLTSLGLISITTGLVVFALTVEIYGASCTLDPFMARKRHCTYSAKCRLSKKHLLASSKEGQVINVEELAKQGHSEHVVDSTV